MSETWVLNETLAKPSWTYRSANFTNQNFAYDRFLITSGGDDDVLVYINSTTGDGRDAYYWETNSWRGQPYRTITFDEPVTDTTLLAWLQANGTKQ